MFNSGGYSSYQVEKVIVGVSGVYNDMVARPFNMHTSESSLDEFMLKTKNGLNVNQNTVQLENQNIIQISPESHGLINMDGGWNTMRNVFTMVIVNIHDNTKYILSGFTSPDFMQAGNINPYATMTFNSVLELQPITDYSGKTTYRIHNADSILAANHLTGSLGNGTITSPQRPLDVINNAILRGEVLMNSTNGDINDDTPIINLGLTDSMGLGSRSPELGRAMNATGNDYLYRTARAFSDAQLTSGGENDIAQGLQDASSSGIIAEGSYREMPLMQHILTTAGDRRNVNVAIEELAVSLPNLYQVMQVIRDDSGVSSQNTEHWLGRGNTQLVAELAAAIPAAMFKNGIQYVGFQMTTCNGSSMDGYSNTFNYKEDMQQGGAMLGFITTDLNQDEFAATFEAYMRTVIFPSICKGRNIVVDISCSIIKDLVISISVDGSHPMNYAAPTWASSYWNPTGATTTASNTSMSSGMYNLTYSMMQRQEGNMSPTNYSGGVPALSAPVEDDLF